MAEPERIGPEDTFKKSKAGAAVRWAAKYVELGYKKSKILSGGVKAWKQAGYGLV